MKKQLLIEKPLFLKAENIVVTKDYVSSIQLSSTHSDVLVSGGDVGNDGP